MTQRYPKWRNTLIVGLALALGSGIAPAGAQVPAGAPVRTTDIEHEEDATESEATVIVASARTNEHQGDLYRDCLQ
jgi:hypothetical protein